MDVEEQAKKIKDWAKKYAEKRGIQLNPDEERVDEVASVTARVALLRETPMRIER